MFAEIGKKDNEVTQSKFECGNKDCKSHDLKHGFNADFNAARNIAKSTLFMNDGQVTRSKQKQENIMKEFPRKYRKQGRLTSSL